MLTKNDRYGTINQLDFVTSCSSQSHTDANGPKRLP